jgi:aspartate racemase
LWAERGGIFTKEIGVIGGLGPMATAYYIELVVRMTEAKYDREHVPMIIYNRPYIPDRTEFILGKSKESPLDAMVSIGKTLVSLGAEYIAIPCITAHYFYQELTGNISVPVINMIGETADYLKANNIEKVGIMATDGTIHSGFFEAELISRGIKVVIPGENCQKKVMSIIYDDIKANRPFNLDNFRAVETELKERGAQVIILGCTELSLIKRDGKTGPGFIDAMEILAKRTIELSGAALKKEYRSLIT